MSFMFPCLGSYNNLNGLICGVSVVEYFFNVKSYNFAIKALADTIWFMIGPCLRQRKNSQLNVPLIYCTNCSVANSLSLNAQT
jgi:hypothetical protein